LVLCGTAAAGLSFRLGGGSTLMLSQRTMLQSSSRQWCWHWRTAMMPSTVSGTSGFQNLEHVTVTSVNMVNLARAKSSGCCWRRCSSAGLQGTPQTLQVRPKMSLKKLISWRKLAPPN
jgi:hypothetical protein